MIFKLHAIAAAKARSHAEEERIGDIFFFRAVTVGMMLYWCSNAGEK